MRNLRNKSGAIIWIVVVFFMMNGGMFEKFFNSTVTEVTQDTYMRTEAYRTDLQVMEDGSYKVDETIGVSFLEPRHGIYRYVPDKGTVVSYDKDGNKEKVPYYADVKLLSSNVTADVSSQNGNQVFRFGEEDNVTQQGKYEFSYQFTPKFQEDYYENIYYNVFPTQWQNPIPKGSSFSITFPKKFDMEQLQFYCGKQGEAKNAEEMLELQEDPNTNSIQGTLKQELSFGEGLTCFANMGEGYFVKTNQVNEIPWIILISSLIIFAIVILLFWCFGRDEPIIPSIQYQPPEELDSAAVGYIVDGQVQDKDILSLIIYWADKGILDIEETDKEQLTLQKVKELPSDAPAYQNTIFQQLFETGDLVNISDLKYQFTDTLQLAKEQLQQRYSSTKGVYTTASKIARGMSLFLTMIPMGIFMLVMGYYTYTSTARIVLQVVMWLCLGGGMLLFTMIIDRWYSVAKSSRKTWIMGAMGLCFLSIAAYMGSYIMRVVQKEAFNYIWIAVIVMLITAVMIVLTGFMKKRTPICVEWMGRLAGLRDFIETAELERMEVIAQETPEMFYHIMPYAYVFGLSEVFAEKLNGLAIPAPNWYHTNQQFTFFDYYLFHSCMMRNMNQMTTTLTTPAPVSVDEGATGGLSGGSFGGGFSGGGFGGGGGGSW
ncbi:MAG: DUF2207 domain-containing protein [Lachnospiraceae bacterium]